jgi:hypothetical protein
MAPFEGHSCQKYLIPTNILLAYQKGMVITWDTSFIERYIGQPALDTIDKNRLKDRIGTKDITLLGHCAEEVILPFHTGSVRAPKYVLMIFSGAFTKRTIIWVGWIVPMGDLTRQEIFMAQLDRMRTTGAMDRGGKMVSFPIDCRDNVARPAVAVAQPIKERGSMGRVPDGASRNITRQLYYILKLVHICPPVYWLLVGLLEFGIMDKGPRGQLSDIHFIHCDSTLCFKASLMLMDCVSAGMFHQEFERS